MITTFCGHSQLYNKPIIEKQLKGILSALILEGCTKFYLGGYGDFDNLAECRDNGS